MRKSLTSMALTISLLSSSASLSLAQGIPVIDQTSIAQLIAQLSNQATQIANQATQIQNQIDQFNKLQEQLTNMEQRLQAITGSKDISSILNSPANITERAAANSLDDILDGAINGGTISGGGTGRLQASISGMKTKFDLTNLETFDSSNVPQDRAIATLAGAGLTAAATGKDSYERSNQAMERVTNLIGQIDNTADLKSSVDLNTRMLAEVAQMLNENLRVQAAIANANGTLALSQARDRAAGRTFGKIGN